MRGTRGSELSLHNGAWLMLAVARKFDKHRAAPTCPLTFETLLGIEAVSRVTQRGVNWAPIDQ